MQLYDLSGLWECEIPGQRKRVCLPGTLDENGVGHPDSPEKQWQLDSARRAGLWREGDPITTRLTRRCAYEGPATFRRTVEWNVPTGARTFLECERSRKLSLQVNGHDVPTYAAQSLSAPAVFEVTSLVTGHDEFALTCDNSYPGWPRGDIVMSSAASDETQTNWNGLLGTLRLRAEKPAFVSGVRVYPHGGAIDVIVALDTAEPLRTTLRISSPALAHPAEIEADVPAGQSELRADNLPLAKGVRRWDIGEGNLYPLTVAADGLEEKTVSFGARDFAAKGGHLALNGRRVFLRGEVNCAAFPETGHPPMDAKAWRGILQTYRAYGVNCVRFHSHCPPEAAFDAADALGMLMQPELSHWNPEDAFASPESRAYYRGELLSILQTLANHPSFVMLSLGNELHADEDGHAFMAALLAEARRFDPTRLYAPGSNSHYGQRPVDGASDFYTSSEYLGESLRATCAGMTGWLNERGPDFRTNYGPAVRRLRRDGGQPVFSFEVGQYEVLPDFSQIEDYVGVTNPANLRVFRSRAKESGLLSDWPRRVAASGELSLLCYRAEVEAALRTEGMSGISLLSLQDFPGQGTALVGMLNAHLAPKPYAFARPERFASFFCDVLPLALLPRRTYVMGETLIADVKLANYGKEDLRGAAKWSLSGDGFALSGALPEMAARAGALTELGALSVPLPGLSAAVYLTLRVSFCGHENAYAVWVYPDERPVCPEGVTECRTFAEARDALASGGRVYLSPPATEAALPRSIPCAFSTDFWSVGCFPQQSGSMGQLIDADHPLFRDFPTDFYTDWQWWPMARQRAAILPAPYAAIVAELDSCAAMRPMAQLLECRCGGGRLLFSTLGLQDLQAHPEARALLASVYRYLASDEFDPRQEIPAEQIEALTAPER